MYLLDTESIYGKDRKRTSSFNFGQQLRDHYRALSAAFILYILHDASDRIQAWFEFRCYVTRRYILMIN